MFKIGERVVFVNDTNMAPFVIAPKLYQDVVIAAYCDTYKGNYDLVGFRTNLRGAPQSFKPFRFRKLDTDWAEKVLAEVLESELVLIEG